MKIDGINNREIVKECYEISLQLSDLDQVEEILRYKIDDLPKNIQKLNKNIKVNSLQESMSNVIMQLSQESLDSIVKDTYSLQSIISSMNDSAEKEYLFALLALCKGNSETQRVEAGKYILNALKKSPNDPRYRVLAEILQQVD